MSSRISNSRKIPGPKNRELRGNTVCRIYEKKEQKIMKIYIFKSKECISMETFMSRLLICIFEYIIQYNIYTTVGLNPEKSEI